MEMEDRRSKWQKIRDFETMAINQMDSLCSNVKRYSYMPFIESIFRNFREKCKVLSKNVLSK